MMQENVDEFGCNPNKDSSVASKNDPSSVQSSGNIRRGHTRRWNHHLIKPNNL